MNSQNVIFFDMGNTLLHFHHGDSDEHKDEKGLLYLTEYLQQFHANILKEDVKHHFLDPWFEAIEMRHKTHKELSIETFLLPFLSTYQVTLTKKERILAIDAFYQEYRCQLFYEDSLFSTLSLLKQKGYRLGVISNTCYYDEVMKHCFQEAGIYDFFDCYTFSYSNGFGKPHQSIFESALTSMNIIPSNAVMVGDNLSSDIEPANQLGMKTFWLNKMNKSNLSNLKPDYTIHSLSQLLDFV